MLTFKQVEAVHWIARLGSLVAAAKQLNTTQAAISKRLAEIESLLDVKLFDRVNRSVRLTDEGRAVLATGEELLRLRDKLMASVGKEALALRHLRVGVTELTALTWLPQFAACMRDRYPQVQLQPEIDLSANLCEKLERGATDFIVVPPVFNSVHFQSEPLGELELAWMCSPQLVTKKGPLSLSEITSHPVLMQVERSGVDMGFEQWIREQDAELQRVYAGNSLVALSALTMQGFGISYLPKDYFMPLVQAGRLRVIRSRKPIPPVRYYAVYRREGAVAFHNAVAGIAKSVCDFGVSAITVDHHATPGRR